MIILIISLLIVFFALESASFIVFGFPARKEIINKIISNNKWYKPDSTYDMILNYESHKIGDEELKMPLDYYIAKTPISLLFKYHINNPTNNERYAIPRWSKWNKVIKKVLNG